SDSHDPTQRNLFAQCGACAPGAHLREFCRSARFRIKTRERKESKPQRDTSCRCGAPPGKIRPAMKRRIIFLANLRSLAVPNLFISALAVYCTHNASGVTLQPVLRSSPQRNPAILEPKSALGGAAWQRRGLGSVAWR